MKDEEIKLRYKKYQEGYSLAEVGKAFGVSRQSVYECFKKRGYKLRPKKELEAQYFQQEKFTPQNNGYLRSTLKSRTLMHRIVWEHFNGKIPKGYDIHHINHDRTDNRISNLELMSKSEHAKKYSTGNNQFKKKVINWEEKKS